MGHEFEPLSARIIEAAIAVHKALGPGFLESIYHAALRVALSRSGIPYENNKGVCIYFEGVEVGLHQLDLLVDGQIVVELKAIKALAAARSKSHFGNSEVHPAHRAAASACSSTSTPRRLS